MKGPLRSSAIADELRVSRGAISNLTERLVEEGFVRRLRSQEDRRVVQIELTEAGRAFLREKESDRIERLSSLFGELDLQDLDDLLRICRRIVEVLDRNES
jgi:DNA-binding MarR family transcriptional regulator